MPGLRKSADVGKYIAFGSGVGIEIAGRSLEVTVVRVRPAGIDVLGTTTIAGFASRPAAEWGREYARFLRTVGGSHLSATVMLPRRETIVRQIALPGVAARDLDAAIALQIDTLHPYGEEEVVWGWSRVVTGGVLLGILRRSTLERYVALFAEAGIAVTSFTFSAAAIYAAHRLPVARVESPADGFVAAGAGEEGTVEVYGESPTRGVFSAEFDLPPDRAVALAISELRLAPDVAPVPLDRVLPAPRHHLPAHDLSGRAFPYATALAGACPWLTAAANLLPVEHRRSNSRAMYIPTVVLGMLLLVAGGAVAAHSAIEDRHYLRELEAEIARLEPEAKKAVALDRQIARVQNRTWLVDEFRGRTKADLGALNELTKLLAPPTWANMIDLTPDAATITGEAEQAAPLLKTLDASSYFQNSTFVGSITKAAGNEQFQIRTARKAQ